LRTILARGNGIALAEWMDGDREWLDEHDDGAFEVDVDDRPVPPPHDMHRAVVVSEDGELLGGVSWHKVTYGRGYGCLAWNIGGALVPASRGRGIGTRMWHLMARHLFETTDLDRVEASTDVTNLPTQRSLEKAGFLREGVIRGAQLRDGVRHDLVGYGVLRTDVTDEKLTAGQNGSAELASGNG
jgi:RimJ/RimL family protein N-acetyltransferase